MDVSIEYIVKGQKSLTVITVAGRIKVAWQVMAMFATTSCASRLCATKCGGERRSEESESRNLEDKAVELHLFCRSVGMK